MIMLQVINSSSGRKSLNGKHIKSVAHDLCPRPPRPSPKTTKDFWVIALPPAGVPSQSFTRLIPERQHEKNIFSILFLKYFL